MVKMSSRRRKESKRPGSNAYAGLDQLSGRDMVNIIGVVVDSEVLMPNKPSKSHPRYCFRLVDEAGVELECTLVGPGAPQAATFGDIMIVRRVSVREHADGLSVWASSENPWWLCRKDKGFTPLSNIANLELSVTEKRRIGELMPWAAMHLSSDITERAPKQFKESSPGTSAASAVSSLSSVSVVSAVSSPTHYHHFTTVNSHTPLAQASPALSTNPAPPVHTSPALSPSTAHTSSTLSSSTPTTRTSSISTRTAHPSPALSNSTSSTTVTTSSAPSLQSLGPRVSRPSTQRYYDISCSTINNQVIGDRSAGVIGVLKYFKLPAPSKGRDHFTALCLVDETQHTSGLPCVIFNPLKDLLPVASQPGQVVLVKGLTINSYQGSLQGRGHEHTLVGIFSGDPDEPVPKKIDDFYELKGSERVRVQHLRAWAAKDRAFLLNSRLEELSPFNYCCCVCLVLKVGVVEGGATVLTVCDGTIPRSEVNAVTAPLTLVSHIPNLLETYQGLTSVVTLAPSLQAKVSAGDVVQLINLYMERSHAHQSADPPSSVAVELVLQDNPECLGSVVMLPKEDPCVVKFRDQLPEPEAAAVSSLPSHLRLSTVLGPSARGAGQVTLAQLRRSQVGKLNVAEVKVMGVNKDMCQTLESICQLRCAGCKTLYQMPLPQDEDYPRLMSAGDVCVHCSTEDICEPNRLQYMYGFTLLVSDHSSQIEVAVSGEDGRKLFSELKLVPANLHADEDAKAHHWKILSQLAGSTTSPFYDPTKSSGCEGPSVKLCLSVYLSFKGNRRYRVVDTSLCFI